MNGSVRPSVRLPVRHTFLTMFPSSYHHEIFRSYYQWQKWRPCKKSRSDVNKVTEVKNRRIWPKLGVSGLKLPFQFTNGYEMMHKAWSGMEEVPYCFSRSSVKLQGHTALKIVEFDPNWAFPDCNSSLNSPIARKWCTELEVAWKICPIVFSCDQAALQMVFSVCPSVTPFWLCFHHRIIMNISGVITNDQNKVHAKGQGQMSKV